ncbi:DUF6624 domain-containing protein [Streptomyces sp. CBMA152]|uniref:DUF6624 domain-containing protein n=1 Tax=Streptomyces sp. CBMA152 TaxID=1896312 RepID=UPI001660526B|nr:DUF6624 domain-containing protein [Streptomyces sp. CBMA152]MBD0743823.1 hypothetical protein [Streptomyces sp. CBMA152]
MTPQRPDLADELLRRRAADQHARGVREHGMVAADLDAMRAVDSDNVTALKRITAEHGWPGRTLVGQQAMDAAWLLAQHADADPDFQQEALLLLREAVAAGEAEPRHLAYLTDRCLVHEGEPQLYGTQYVKDEQGLRPYTIREPNGLDSRRAEIGLGPFAEYDAQMREHY